MKVIDIYTGSDYCFYQLKERENLCSQGLIRQVTCKILSEHVTYGSLGVADGDLLSRMLLHLWQVLSLPVAHSDPNRGSSGNRGNPRTHGGGERRKTCSEGSRSKARVSPLLQSSLLSCCTELLDLSYPVSNRFSHNLCVTLMEKPRFYLKCAETCD